MTLSLHAALIPNWLQMLGAVDGLLDKAQAFVADGGLDEEAFLQSRLAEDMLPLAYQVKSCWAHTALALRAVPAGRFSPDMAPPPLRIADLRALMAEAREECERADPDTLEQAADQPLVFAMGDTFRLPFTVRDFLLSFSQSNLYFHASIAYAIMRMQGVPLGKRDFLGALRLAQG